jgi:glycosyltransferase involved in cell wall biosynthesis
MTTAIRHPSIRGGATSDRIPGHAATVAAPIAYLNSAYPSLSHTFIEREVRAVRTEGLDIRTFSVRPTGSAGRLGKAHRAAAAETTVLLDHPLRVLVAFLGAAAASPVGAVRALVASQRLSPPGLGARLTHLAYVAEAMRLARHLRRLGISHIHVHMANNGASAALLATEYDRGLSYSLTIHGSAEFFDVTAFRLAPKVERAVFVRCISEFCRAQVMAWTRPEAWPRFHVVHCGIDPAAFAPKPPRTQGPLRLLTVGRLHPIKGYTVLLEALRLLSDKGRDWMLDMVGDGPLEPALRAQAAALGIAERIRFSGAVAPERVQDHYDRADAIVVSSFMEGVPVVLMEAMAKELGAVATRVGGVPELIDDGVHGVLVPPGSAGGLAAAIGRLAEDPSLCRRFGAAGRRRILEQFSIANTGRAMVDLLRPLASPSDSTGGRA